MVLYTAYECLREQNIISVYCVKTPMRGEICSFTTLEFICSVFTVFLAVAQPHTGDAVPAWTGKVAFLALLPVGNWDEKQNRQSPPGISDD